MPEFLGLYGKEKIISYFCVQVKNAKRVVLVGGGAVGVELAGEIMTAYPDKEVNYIPVMIAYCLPLKWS